MYYEEKVIGGALHYRTSPNDDFRPCSPEFLTSKLQAAKASEAGSGLLSESGVRQQAEAWMGVSKLLDELRPGWILQEGKNGLESALETIRDLAESSAQQTDCDNGQNCVHCEPEHGCRPKKATGTQQAEAEPVAWISKNHLDCDPFAPVCLNEIEASGNSNYIPLYTAPPSPAPVVPEGFALVPKHATREMIKVGVMARTEEALFRYDPKTNVQQLWKAMLSVAPQPAEQERTCRWVKDSHLPGTYETECDGMWSFTEDGLAENEARYCPYCGGKIVEGE